jgi:hypothetical protein
MEGKICGQDRQGTFRTDYGEWYYGIRRLEAMKEEQGREGVDYK